MSPEQFKAIRLDLGLSQARLGELLRVTDRTVRRWEGGFSGIEGPVEVCMEMLEAGALTP